ncbi:lipocalin-like domain-containing protein [Algoriphagus chordae]|uniref:Lipocalin-like protein n=1 Tax=Algoriphagus chordae TaxID=237019 RepID=A0A2W7QI47_9BACT|nr:lipocalin family protein [Algoriphagus chordae]PZX47781.1 lipocalin-like protein [Algoriphagus chordae]
MNKIEVSSRFLVCLPLLVLTVMMFSCTDNLEEKLVGSWKGSDQLFVKKAGPSIPVTINGGIERHLNSSFNLNEDGTYQKLVGEYDNGSGTWELKDDQLIIHDKSGNDLTYTLIKLTDKELVTIHKVSMETPSGELSGNMTLSYTR